MFMHWCSWWIHIVISVKTNFELESRAQALSFMVLLSDWLAACSSSWLWVNPFSGLDSHSFISSPEPTEHPDLSSLSDEARGIVDSVLSSLSEDQSKHFSLLVCFDCTLNFAAEHFSGHAFGHRCNSDCFNWYEVIQTAVLLTYFQIRQEDMTCWTLLVYQAEKPPSCHKYVPS